MVNINNLSFEYPNTLALNKVNLYIPSGTITALVGPNGAGKTTLLHCLSVLSKPITGSIYIDNIDVLENPLIAKKIVGYLPDFFGLYDNLTIYQNLEYFAYAHKLDEQFSNTEIKALINENIGLVNLTDKTHSKISTLSRGMRQRVGIAQTIIHKPKLLLLDEPASGLDPEARIELANLLRTLQNIGITLIVSSHILAELNEYADNLIIINNGKIRYSGELNLLNSKANTLTIKFIYLFEHDIIKINECELLSNVVIEENTATANYNGEIESKNMIMQYLISNGIQVVELSEKKINIQDEYLNFMKGEK